MSNETITGKDGSEITAEVHNGGNAEDGANPHPFAQVTYENLDVIVTRSGIDDKLMVDIAQQDPRADVDIRVALNDGDIWDQSTDTSQRMWIATVEQEDEDSNDHWQPAVYLSRTEDGLFRALRRGMGVDPVLAKLPDDEVLEYLTEERHQVIYIDIYDVES